MVCEITYGRQAKKSLEDLERTSKSMANRIKERIQQLAENPICDEKLKPPFQEFCKTRVGHYRIVYLLKSCSIIVVYIRKREDFYDKLRRIL